MSLGRDLEDEEWIPLAGEKGACIITQDYNIKHVKHQRVLCERYNLGMFYFRPPSKSGFRYWDMISLIVKHWLEISKIAISRKRPFAFRVTSKGKLEEIE